MKNSFRSYLLLHVSTGSVISMESAVLSYLWTEEPVRSPGPQEEPPPSILRRLSAEGPMDPAVERNPGLPAARPSVTTRTRRTPPRPWV
jgi:hypothetical protein